MHFYKICCPRFDVVSSCAALTPSNATIIITLTAYFTSPPSQSARQAASQSTRPHQLSRESLAAEAAVAVAAAAAAAAAIELLWDCSE